MTLGEILQELDLLMLEEGYIEVSEKIDMVGDLIEEKGGTPKMHRKAMMHLYGNYSYFEIPSSSGDEDDEDVYFYNAYDSYESFEEFCTEFNIK